MNAAVRSALAIAIVITLTKATEFVSPAQAVSLKAAIVSAQSAIALNDVNAITVTIFNKSGQTVQFKMDGALEFFGVLIPNESQTYEVSATPDDPAEIEISQPNGTDSDFALQNGGSYDIIKQGNRFVLIKHQGS